MLLYIFHNSFKDKIKIDQKVDAPTHVFIEQHFQDRVDISRFWLSYNVIEAEVIQCM